MESAVSGGRALFIPGAVIYASVVGKHDKELALELRTAAQIKTDNSTEMQTEKSKDEKKQSEKRCYRESRILSQQLTCGSSCDDYSNFVDHLCLKYVRIKM